jgi:hypothetical protein
MANVAGEGTLVLTGAFQTLFEGSTFNTFEGLAGLDAMVASDVVVIKLEGKAKSGDIYGKIKDDETYTGPMDGSVGKSPKVSFAPRTSKYGYKVSIKQTGTGVGGFKSVPFIFYKF